jgi:uracil-DNA glycosylase
LLDKIDTAFSAGFGCRAVICTHQISPGFLLFLDHQECFGRVMDGHSRTSDQSTSIKRRNTGPCAKSDSHVVKHFNWEPRRKRRLHSKPSSREIAACRPWLDAELKLLHPRVVVCLGATAAQALLGREFRVTKRRGEVVNGQLCKVVATYHPAAILRAPVAVARHQTKQALVDDFRVAARAAAEP